MFQPDYYAGHPCWKRTINTSPTAQPWAFRRCRCPRNKPLT
ncbi:Uncharacterised protein [Bordetella pertussis]|nr:Uncharacterised protein [Bordetella pertussis]